MPKTFYTEKDIEDLVKRSVLSLEVNDQVVLTDLAYEKAQRLGMKLVRENPDNPPSAPMRPYLSQKQAARPPETLASAARTPATPVQAGAVPAPQKDGADLHQRIHDAVIARLGNQVDAKLLDVIITRVLQNTGVK
jgi:hypothetical protein